jgi:hypothetical protein
MNHDTSFLKGRVNILFIRICPSNGYPSKCLSLIFILTAIESYQDAKPTQWGERMLL